MCVAQREREKALRDIWTLIYHGKLANQIARLAAIVVKINFSNELNRG